MGRKYWSSDLLGGGEAVLERPGEILDVIEVIKRFCCYGGAALLLLGCAASDRDVEEESLAAALKESAWAAQMSYDYKSATAHFLRLYELRPDNFQALLGHARNLRYSGLPKEAIKAMKRGIAAHGKRPELILELAKAQLAASLIADSRENLEKALEITPDNWEIYATSGILYDRIGLFKDAHGEYRKALELFPGNVKVLNNLALSLAQAGNLDEAIAILEDIVKSENSIVQVRQNLAVLYALKGNLEGAERLAREDLPPDAVTDNLSTFRRLSD